MFAVAAAIGSQLLQAQPAGPADTAAEIVKAFAAGELSVVAVQKLHGFAQAERHGGYWELRSASGRESIVIRSPDPDSAADEVVLHFSLESGLLLSALEERFGKWQLIYASKTSSVKFSLQDSQKRQVLLIVGLFSSPPTPGAPVLTLKLLRGN